MRSLSLSLSLARVALGSQHAMYMRHIVCHLWPPQLYNILPRSHKRDDFRKNLFRFSLQLLSEIFLILGRIQQHIINIHRPSRKVPVGLSHFDET